MKQSRVGLMSLLATALVASVGAQMPVALPATRSTSPRRSSRPARRVRYSGKRYPEQSSRQAMRGQRRAQGGPGLVLVDGVYQPREAL